MVTFPAMRITWANGMQTNDTKKTSIRSAAIRIQNSARKRLVSADNTGGTIAGAIGLEFVGVVGSACVTEPEPVGAVPCFCIELIALSIAQLNPSTDSSIEIGRASCRERV